MSEKFGRKFYGLILLIVVPIFLIINFNFLLSLRAKLFGTERTATVISVDNHSFEFDCGNNEKCRANDYILSAQSRDGKKTNLEIEVSSKAKKKFKAGDTITYFDSGEGIFSKQVLKDDFPDSYLFFIAIIFGIFYLIGWGLLYDRYEARIKSIWAKYFSK